MRTLQLLSLTVLAFLAGPTLGHAAFQRGAEILQPSTYDSPSGTLQLFVDPGRRGGEGPGVYSMTRGTQPAWEKTLPFTLWDAQVTNSGYVVGYAYSEGYADHAARGSIHVVVLDPQGELLLDDVTRRVEDRKMGAVSSTPRVQALLVYERHDLFFVEVWKDEPQRAKLGIGSGRLKSTWRAYRLSTGECLEKIGPQAPTRAEHFKVMQGLEASPVASTELTLVHWLHAATVFPGHQPGDEALFCLVDRSGEIVWTRRGKYDSVVAPGSGRGQVANQHEATETSFNDTVAMFALLSGTRGRRAEFLVARVGGQWKVTEIFREGGAAPEQQGQEPSLLKLKHLGTTVLRPSGSALASTIRNIQSYGFDDDGELGFIRRDGDSYVFVRPTVEGEAAFERRMPTLFERADWVAWFHGVGDFWYASARVGQLHKLYRVDVRRGEAVALGGHAWPRVDQLVMKRDGGFVLLGRESTEPGQGSVLISVDPEGKLLFRTTGLGGGVEAGGFGVPRDMAVATDGTILLLHAGEQNLLQRFTAHGKFMGSVQLAESWGEEPKSPGRIVADAEGGVWVVDFGQLWHMTLEGELFETLTPTLPYGNRVPLGGLRAAPDGTLWSTDVTRFLSISAGGGVERTIGWAPVRTGLENPLSGWIDFLGRILIQDRFTPSWGVFDRRGKQVMLASIPASFHRERSRRPRPVVKADGGFYAPLKDGTHFQFSAVGKPLGPVDLGQMKGHGPRDEHGSWIAGDRRSSLEWIGADGALKKTLGRRPDGEWFHFLGAFHQSMAGQSLAILDGPSSGAGRRQQLCLLDGEGRNGSIVELPGTDPVYHVTTSQRWAVVSGSSTHVLLVNLKDQTLHRVLLDESSHSWVWGFDPEGEELWGVDIDALQLKRFALPD